LTKGSLEVILPVQNKNENKTRNKMNKTKQKTVARRKGYRLLENGELWTTGRYAYMAGYVSDPGNIDNAIDNHEEELRVSSQAFLANYEGMLGNRKK